MNRKPKMGWLYLLIVLLLIFSGVMAWGLIDKLQKQQESAEDYTKLSGEAIVTGVTVFADETAASETAEPQQEQEAVDQSDTVFYISHDVVAATAANTLQAASTWPTGISTLLPAETPGQTPAPSATQTRAATDLPSATQTLAATVTPTATLAATPAPVVTVTAASQPTLAPGETATVTRPPAGSGWALITATPATEKAGVEATATAGAEATPESTPALTPAASPTPASTAVSPVATALPQATDTPKPTYTPIATVTPTVTPEKLTVTPAISDVPGHNQYVTMEDVHYSADFGYLQGINPDVKAWLIQDGTVINYPVLQGKDNDYYLDRMFNGKRNKDGSIFLDSGSSEYFLDANTYIYGHHTKTDAMFSTLANYRDQAYYDAHPQMVLLTPYSDYCIDLFAARVAAVDDETTWRVKQFYRKADFSAYISDLETNSLFKADASSMPEWGDQLLVLVTCTNDQHGMRYVVYGRMRQIVYASTDSVAVTKMKMDQTQTLGGWREVPGRGLMMTYAQNDPLWEDMRYESLESARKRVFGEGGCGPTSVAMAVANLVPLERLSDIYGYAKSSQGYTFCECSVNQYFCNKLHAQYQVQTADEYLRYFPLVMANFATGNNLWGQVSRGKAAGTNLTFIKKIAYLYKLDLSITYDKDETFAAVKDGAIAIASLGAYNPLTGGGHYAVIASVDDQYVYVLDPYRKESYDDTDKKHILNQIAPGVLAVKLEDARDLYMSTFYILKTTPETDSADPPAVQ